MEARVWAALLDDLLVEVLARVLPFMLFRLCSSPAAGAPSSTTRPSSRPAPPCPCGPIGPCLLIFWRAALPQCKCATCSLLEPHATKRDGINLDLMESTVQEQGKITPHGQSFGRCVHLQQDLNYRNIRNISIEFSRFFNMMACVLNQRGANYSLSLCTIL